MTRRSPIAAALLVALLASPAAARTARAPTAPAAAQGVDLLRLVDRTAWVGDGLDFALALQVLSAPVGSELRVSVHDRVRNRTELTRSIAGEGLRRRVSGPTSVPLAVHDPDGDGALTLAVPLVAREGITPVTITRAGTYPVVVELVGPDGEVLDTLGTHLVRLPSADPDSTDVPLRVAVLAAIAAPPVDLDPTAAGPVGGQVDPLVTLVTAMAAHPEIPLTLQVLPETLVAAAAEQPSALAAFRDALGASEVAGSPWVDLDEAAWADADDGVLSRQLARGTQALAGALGIEPSSTRVLEPGSPLAEAVAMVDHGASALVVAADDLEALDERDFPYTLARPFGLALDADPEGDAGPVATIPALASDPGLEAIAATVEADPILAAHLLLADLAVLAADEPDSARVVTLVLPEEAAGSAAFLDALLGGLEPPIAPPPPSPPPVDPEADPNAPLPVTPEPIPAAEPVVVAAPIATALREVEPAGADGPVDPDDPLVRHLVTEATVPDVRPAARLLRAGQADLASMRGVFGPQDPLAARIEVVLATAAASTIGNEVRQQVLRTVDTAITARIAGLHPPERQRVRLTARQGQIQLVLANDTGLPADVVLQLRGDRLRFLDAPDGRLPVRLAPGITRVDLRVEALSSGDAPLDIVLTSPDGRIQMGDSRITVRATVFSGVGVVLMGGALVFLAAWWTRTIIRERRTTRRRHPSHLRHQRADA